MPEPTQTSGATDRPILRVAVVGAGPAGYYSALDLFGHDEYDVHVDMFDRIPTPYGLVRYGVAPDHAKIKSVIKVYERGVEAARRSFPAVRQRRAGHRHLRGRSPGTISRGHPHLRRPGRPQARRARRGPAWHLRRP